ncbi:alpha-hydroxy-acid oxidizing protein [Glaciimonas sp. PCH181]|uniref:alpha-hydroxy-acid oxidizing protein n=1 Tax=Glaciimonas sp. PCH181 TaxID=2133943 RepID=UPI000D3B139D|nr:alpha-hydroxy-acid oxidizing protein [Glaciimonas sp. PCH181]PUA19489.1 hypothetical protein C7W93_06410 [Glaciimonas sp. PCH181]
MINEKRRRVIKSLTAGSALAGIAGQSILSKALAAETPHAIYTDGYSAGTEVKRLLLNDLIEIEGMASKIIPAGGFGYISGGAGDEWTLHENRTAFGRKQIIPRVLTGKGPVDLKSQIFGIPLTSPIIVPPIGSHGLAHISAEAGTAMGAAAAGTIMGVSTVSTLNLEQVAAASNSPKWFQLYMMQDIGFSRELLQRAKAAGYKAIVLTVDTTATGNREADARNHFKFPLQFGNLTSGGAGGSIQQLNSAFAITIDPKVIEFAIKETGLPVIVKGIEHPDDARIAIDAGAAAIQVSNHGGRQLDGSPATFTVLPSIAKAVNRRVPIIFDSGIRRGQDVFKAIASGADVVGLGRPVIYGLSLGGWMGVQSVFELINKELAMVMQLAGAETIEDIKHIALA